MIIEKIHKQTLDNGLTVLVIPNHQIPKVSIQLWYNVGSKDERSSQKGIAHLIEHMIFKGTTSLSESDINQITHKLSGYCNAFTSNDYTGYLFDFPMQHWTQALAIMADCMRNCTFKEEFLNSELKAVIQELKMYNDDYSSTLIERMLGSIFKDHPYRYPIIGYKRDLWSLKRDSLIDFYQYHYVPNNAVLVVVGDVTSDEVFDQAEKYFGAIPADPSYAKERFYHSFDLEATVTTLQRDVQQPFCLLAWTMPGLQEKQDYILDLMSWIIGSGKGSRLYRILVDELGWVTEVESFVYDLFEHSLFFIEFQPQEGVAVQKIIDRINQELDLLIREGATDVELVRAVKKTQLDILSLRENNQKLAYLMGKYYTALGDESYLACYNQINLDDVPGKLQGMMHTYLRQSRMHQGFVQQLADKEKKYWLELQEQSDNEDAMVLSRITRSSGIEDGSHVKKITAEPPKEFKFPRAEVRTLTNGLKVLFYHNPSLPKIELVLDFKAKHYFDPEDKQGLSVFLYDMLQEGTKHHTAQEFAQELEQHGMSLNTFPGHITMNMLSSDIGKGLGFLADIVTRATLSKESVEKVRLRLLADVIDFWDDPSQFSGQLVRERVYGKHPYHKRVLGSVDSIRAITREDIAQAYEHWITPQESRIAIVGDLSNCDIVTLLEEKLGPWSGNRVEDVLFPKPPQPLQTAFNYPINRDQIHLCFGRLSIDRLHPDFDKILLFEQIFTGGVLGSMNSRLFKLREQSGLFYTIGGSLLAGSGKHEGMLFIKTIISPDRLTEAEDSIKAVIDQGASSLTNDELDDAKRAVINSLVDNFSSNAHIATTLLFIDMFGFPPDYFDKRPQTLLAITKEEVQAAAGRLLQSESLVTVRTGRL